MSTSNPEPPVSKPIPIPSFRPTQVFRRDRRSATDAERVDPNAHSGRSTLQNRAEA
jgi:hypothetical protein